MGICEATNEQKNITSDKQKTDDFIKVDDENSNNKDTHPSSNNEQEGKSSTNSEIKKNKCPELAKYDNSMYYSGKKSDLSLHNNKTLSFFSSGHTEEEVIIRGEINKDCKNKEEDFANNSFKRLIQNNGGIVIKKEDKYSNISSIHKITPSLGFKKEKVDIKSVHTFHVKKNNGRILANIKRDNDLTNKNKSENNKSLINNRINKFLNENYNVLRLSNKINVSMNENYPYLSVPKVDEPLPDIDELSTESPIPLGNNF